MRCKLMNKTLVMPMIQFSAECPECQHRIRLQRKPRLLQLVNCIGCDEILIVTSIKPPQLDWALDFEPVSIHS